MLRLFFSTILTVTVAAVAAGQTFDVRPGQLAAEGGVPASAATVTVTGSVDASDLDYLVRTIEEVATLDLSGAEIAAYKGVKTGVNIYSVEANVLPPYIFAGLKARSVKLPSTLTVIGEGALMDSRVEEVEIPAGVTRIGADAFIQCRSLKRTVLPEAITEVAPRTFEGCAMLAEVTLPAGVTKISDRAFLGCSSLGSIEMPASLVSIGPEAFALSGLNGASLDACRGLTAVGDRAFASCMQLGEVTLPSGATTLGEGIFFDCISLSHVQLPAEAVTLPALTLKGAENLAEIELPAGIAEIGTLAMAGMSGMERVELPAALEYLADGAMEGWSGVKEIDVMQLNVVPELGPDVWAGVEQEAVTLQVPAELENSYLAAPQWQDFAISRSSLTELPAIDAADGKVEAAFNGKNLVVSASSPLHSVTLYGIDGRMLEVAENIAANSVSIETSRHAGAFFIVRAVTEADGGGTTFKLMREP